MKKRRRSGGASPYFRRMSLFQPMAGRRSPAAAISPCSSYSFVWSKAWRFFRARVARNPMTQQMRMYALIVKGVLVRNGEANQTPNNSYFPVQRYNPMIGAGPPAMTEAS